MFDKVLALLDHMRRRTGMYVQPVEIATVQSFLHGLQKGCAFGGLKVTQEVYEAVAAARGWKWRAAGIIWHIKAKKLDDAAIIQELITVQMEAFRQATSGKV